MNYPALVIDALLIQFKKFVMKYSILTLFLVLVSCHTSQAQQSLLWEIKSPDGKLSYLFGTYHLVGGEYLEAHPKVQRAFDNSDKVVVETVIDSSKMMEAAMMAMMPEHSLWDFYDTAQFNLIDQKLKSSMGISISAFANMRPIAIAMMYVMGIAQDDISSSGLNFEGEPLDVHIALRAKKLGKQLISLETMMEQLELIYKSDPAEEQAQMLLDLVQDTGLGKASSELVTLYEKEDLNGMMILSEKENDPYTDMAVLVDDRNKKWISKLVPLLDEGNVFIAVGALHLPGELGLIQLLTEESFELRPVLD